MENAESVLKLIKQYFPNHRWVGRDSKVSSLFYSACLLALTQTQHLSPRLSEPARHLCQHHILLPGVAVKLIPLSSLQKPAVRTTVSSVPFTPRPGFPQISLARYWAQQRYKSHGVSSCWGTLLRDNCGLALPLAWPTLSPECGVTWGTPYPSPPSPSPFTAWRLYKPTPAPPPYPSQAGPSGNPLHI